MSLNSLASLKKPPDATKRLSASPRIGKYLEGAENEVGEKERERERDKRRKSRRNNNDDLEREGDEEDPSPVIRVSIDETRYGATDRDNTADFERGSREHSLNPMAAKKKGHGQEDGYLIADKDAAPSRFDCWRMGDSFSGQGKFNRRAIQRAIFNWETLKIVTILSLFVFTLWLFTSNESAHEAEKIMTYAAATSAANPLYYQLNANDPLDYIAIHVTCQRLIHGLYPEEGVNVTFAIEAFDGVNDAWVSVKNWSVPLSYDLEEVDHDFMELEDKLFKNLGVSKKVSRLAVLTNSPQPVGMTLKTHQLGWIIRYQVLIAAIILVLVYILIIFELIHRTLVALMGSFCALGVLSAIQERPAFLEVVAWIDYDTLGLLFGMMIMVGIFSDTGFFEYSAVKAYKFSKGHMWRLLVILCILVAVLSAFLDNVTTILLLTPVTIRLCKVIDIDPVPLILAEVVFCNIGGTSTVIGDPPNILIVNDPKIMASGEINFGNFILHVGPGILIITVVCFVVLKFMYRKRLRRQLPPPKLRELDIWKRTAERIRVHDSEEERQVKAKLLDYVKQLEYEMETEGEQGDQQPGMVDITELEEKYQISDMGLFVKCCTVLSVVIGLFFLHSFVEVNLNLAWIAIIGAMVLLLVSGIRDVETVLEKIELGTLMFFAGLFVLMRALEEMELMSYIAELAANEIVGRVPEGDGRLIVAMLVIIWIGSTVGAFIDNIPFTKAMIPVAVEMASPKLGLPLQPLVWALAFGTCLGGNGTLIGASANVVAAGLCEQQGHPISFMTFFKVGMPMMLVSVTVASIYMILFHVVIPWY